MLALQMQEWAKLGSEADRIASNEYPTVAAIAPVGGRVTAAWQSLQNPTPRQIAHVLTQKCEHVALQLTEHDLVQVHTCLLIVLASS